MLKEPSSPRASVPEGVNIPLIDDDVADAECEICGDTGYLLVDEDDGEGHTRWGVSQRPCQCQFDKNGWDAEDDEEDDDYPYDDAG